MTKPETGWALVPREPTEAMKEAAYRKRPFYTGENHAVIYKTMLSAAPLAPSTPDAGVVKEWGRASAYMSLQNPEAKVAGDRMAAALTAQAAALQEARMQALSDEGQARELSATITEQAKRIEGQRADLEVYDKRERELTNERADLVLDLNAAESRATTAEAALETARVALDKIDDLTVDAINRREPLSSGQVQTITRAVLFAALAKPSTSIEGEGK